LDCRLWTVDCGLPTLASRLLGFALDRSQQRRRGVEVQRIAELVRLGRAGRLDARRLLTRVVAPVAALAERSKKVAQRAVAEEVECLVGHLEGDGRLIGPDPARAPLPALALALEIGRCGDVAFLRHPLDDLLDELFEL